MYGKYTVINVDDILIRVKLFRDISFYAYLLTNIVIKLDNKVAYHYDVVYQNLFSIIISIIL